MHLLLVDHLTCPRCGPDFGLILLADEMADRRIQAGSLGCFNCRERYAVASGRAWLEAPGEGRAGPEGDRAEGAAPGDPDAPADPEAAFRVAALLGIRKGPAHVVVAGEAAGLAGQVAGLVEELEVVVLRSGDAPVPPRPSEAGRSELVVGGRIPVRSHALQGAFLDAPWSGTHLEEALRVVRPGGRVVLRDAPEGTQAALEGRGLELLLATDRTLVAVR